MFAALAWDNDTLKDKLNLAIGMNSAILTSGTKLDFFNTAVEYYD
jgi:hypothetical protein